MADSDAAESPVAAEASGQVILVLRNLLAERYPDLGRHVNTVARLCERVAPRGRACATRSDEALTQAAFASRHRQACASRIDPRPSRTR